MKPTTPLSHTKQGASLILVLFAVVFLSFLIVLFLTVATNERSNTAAYVNGLKTDELASGGLELVIDELRKEIADSTHSTPHTGNGFTIYTPLQPKFILPERNVTSTTTNLLKSSLRGTPLYTGGNQLASAVSTLDKSGNGRSVGLDRWEKPALSTSATPLTAPDWIYLSRQGVVIDPAPASASSNTSADFIIGRIAFNVYDIGGLLDLNVAGYPAGFPDVEVGKKGFAALARLQALGLTDAQVEKILAFRNPGSRADYLNYLKDDAHKGFTHTLSGDNRFLSRQELIRFAQRSGFDDKLQLLTMFSREKNAPSYRPTTPTATNPDLATARHISSGRLLFEKRFPLSKLALLANPTANAADLKKYFGLAYDTTTRTFTYVGQGSGPKNQIATLAEIAAEPSYRQPDFFETLKAVILEGSLGQSAGQTASLPEQDSKDFQIIRIGACIIDQYDADYIPTAISFNSSPGDTPVWGIENLPYVNKLQFIGQNPNPQGIFNAAEGSTRNNHPSGSPDYYFRWAVELWNPHVQAYPIPTDPNDPNYVPGPNIKVALGPVGALARVDVYPNPTATDGPGKKAGSPRAISAADTSNEFNIASGYARAAPSIATYYRYFMDPRQIFFGEINAAPITRDAVYTSATLNILTPIYVDLFVRGPDNFLHHYYRSWKIGNGPLNMTGNTNYVSSYMLSDPRTDRMGYFDADWRLNASSGPPNYPTTVSVASRYAWPIRILPSLSTTDSVMNTGSAPTGVGYSSANVYPGLLYENTQAATRFSDPDNVVRIGDGGYAPADHATVPTAQLNPGPASDPTAATNPSRPRILNRPFRNVAELGFAFRDSAWKTLSFSSSDSADAGLLDVFSLHDEEVSAGKININTTHQPLWSAILSESIRVEGDEATGLKDSQADTLATKITNYLTTPTNDPLINVADFVTNLSTPSILDANSFGGAANVALKTQREAVIRAISNGVQSRTWNLLIDVVAQIGRVPSKSTTLDQFVVEGERRYWLQIAIDRFTGEIIDEQLESIVE